MVDIVQVNTPETRRTARQDGPRWGMWVLRLLAPVFVLAIVFLFRRPAIDVLEAVFGLGFLNPVILFVSTAAARILVFVFCFAGLWLVLQPVKWWVHRSYVGIVALLVVFTAINIGFLLLVGQLALIWAALASFLLVANSWPARDMNTLFDDPPARRIVDAGLIAGVGIAEILLPRVFWVRLRRKYARKFRLARIERNNKRFCFWPGIFVAAAICAIQIPTGSLIALGHAAFMSPRAQLIYGGTYSFFSPDDITGIKRMPSSGNLILCGNGLKFIGVWKPNHRTPKLTETQIPTGNNQFCILDTDGGEIIAFDRNENQLTVANSQTFEIIHQRTLPNMPPEGEVFIAVNEPSTSIVIASEDSLGVNDVKSIKVLDRRTFELRFEIDVDAGYVTVHPNRPILYVNYFWRKSGVLAFDLRTGQKIAEIANVTRTDRMVVDTLRDELLVTSPSDAQILVFDAKTLAEKPPIDTLLGSRSLEIDHQRDMLIVSSLLTNRIEFLDLKSRRSLGRDWLGPWLRDVAIDESNATAYVSSRYGVYSVDYRLRGVAEP